MSNKVKLAKRTKWITYLRVNDVRVEILFGFRVSQIIERSIHNRILTSFFCLTDIASVGSTRSRRLRAS